MSDPIIDLFEARLRNSLRAALDAGHGPHRAWADSPAFRRVRAGEARKSRIPSLRLLAIAAVLTVGGATAAGAWLRSNQPPPPTPSPLPTAFNAPSESGWIAYEILGEGETLPVIQMLDGEPIAIRGIATTRACPQFRSDGLLAVAQTITPVESRWDIVSLEFSDGPAMTYEVVATQELSQGPDDTVPCFESEPGGPRFAYTTMIGNDGAFTIAGDNKAISPVGIGRDTAPVVPDFVRWSSDGTSIAYIAGVDRGIPETDPHSEVWITPTDFQTGSRPLFQSNPNESIDDLAWSPDGKALAFRGTTYSVSDDGGPLPTGTFVRIVALNDVGEVGQFIAVDAVDDAGVTVGAGPIWSPDGSQLAWALGGEVRIGRSDGSEWHALPRVMTVRQTEAWATYPLLWSADGSVVLSGQVDEPTGRLGSETSIVAFDVPSGHIRPFLEWRPGGYGRVSWQVLSPLSLSH